MAGFASYDELISEITAGGKALEGSFSKLTGTMHGAGVWHSLARIAGLPAAMADPATTPGAAEDNFAGSLNWAAVTPETKHILTVQAMGGVAGTLMVYDRLCGVSAISLATTGSKTINSAALTRYTDGVGVQAWLEVTTATTVTAPAVTMNSYTDNDANTGQTGTALTFPAAATVLNSLIGPLPLASGDTGVRAVSTINVGTAATAGIVNFLLIKPLVYLPLSANLAGSIDLVRQLASLPRVYDTASLGLAWLATATTTHTIQGLVRLGYS